MVKLKLNGIALLKLGICGVLLRTAQIGDVKCGREARPGRPALSPRFVSSNRNEEKGCRISMFYFFLDEAMPGRVEAAKCLLEVI